LYIFDINPPSNLFFRKLILFLNRFLFLERYLLLILKMDDFSFSSFKKVVGKIGFIEE
jgi:hypothetical protein